YPNVFVTDGDLAMEWAVVLEYPGMQHLFCIWHVKENIKKMLHSNTIGATYKFPNTRLYLECYLYEYQFSWACAFTVTVFTLGIQSTSFVKSQNACIKRVLESSNTSLYELEWKRDTPSSTNVVTIFSTIESLVKCYLRLNVSHFLIEQMKESLYYMASHSTVEEVESLIICESSQ
ncbi:6152_t:CDS:2, partial [Racocetra persica]